MSSPLAVLRRLRPPAEADPLTGYAATRDPLLLAELVRRHGGLVWGVCRRALPHRPDAEDAYQATWLVLAANPGAVRSAAALPAFLHTVAVRTSRRVRQKRPTTGKVDHLPARESADRSGLTALDAELLKLPESLRRPVVLCYLDGRTQDDAARELGLSLSTLKRRLETGKELLRVRLAGRGIDAAAVLAAAGLTGVGAPAVVAGGAGVAATALSTEVLSAMWMLKAKTWAAGVVLAAGLATTGGGLMLAGGQGPGPVVRPANELVAKPPSPAPEPPAAPAAPVVSDAVRAAYQEQYRELEKAIAAAEQAEEAQRRVTDAYQRLSGVSETEKLNNIALVARYRENAIRSRVELAKLKVEIAKLEPVPAAPPPAPAVPQRLIQERLDTARKFMDLDRQIREVGAVGKEESSAFELSQREAARTLYEAARTADPSPTGQLLAAREWFFNARDAEFFFRARAERGLNRLQVALTASLARNEAEAALILATVAAPPAARDSLAPFGVAPAGYAGKVAGTDSGILRVRPAKGLGPLAAVRVSRGGKPVGVLVVTVIAPGDAGPEFADSAGGIMLPNTDGTFPAVQAGDDVRP